MREREAVKLAKREGTRKANGEAGKFRTEDCRGEAAGRGKKPKDDPVLHPPLEQVNEKMAIEVTPETLQSLKELRHSAKYIEEDFYPGAPTEEIRLECERKTNDYIDRAIDSLKQGATREELFELTEKLFESFEHDDTEEREKVGDYVGDLMRLVGIADWTDFI